MANTKISLSVVIRSDDQGHRVEWTNNGDSRSLGPYADADIAENVKIAKERELTANTRHIDEV